MSLLFILVVTLFMVPFSELKSVVGSKNEHIQFFQIIESIIIILKLCFNFQIIFVSVEKIVYCIYYLQFCCRCINEIYGISQVIGIIGADKGLEIFIYIQAVVKYDEFMIITILGGYFVVTKGGVNLVYPLRRNCIIFSGM